MKRFALAVMVFSMAAAGASAAWATAAARFEAVVAQGSTTVNPAFFRVEVATGTVWQAWGPSTQFAPTVDPAPLPPGDYHIYTTTTPMPDGKVIWSLNRLDAVTGRSWVAVGGGNMPLVWNEILMPK